jgi:hypothetical protein
MTNSPKRKTAPAKARKAARKGDTEAATQGAMPAQASEKPAEPVILNAKGKPRKKAGRPPTRRQPKECMEEICARLSAGESIDQISDDRNMPDKAAIYREMRADETFATNIARARALQQDAIVEETVKLADTATAENWQVRRLQIATRQWRAGKLAPKRYGERLQTDTTIKHEYAEQTDEALKESIVKDLERLGLTVEAFTAQSQEGETKH